MTTAPLGWYFVELLPPPLSPNTLLTKCQFCLPPTFSLSVCLFVVLCVCFSVCPFVHLSVYSSFIMSALLLGTEGV